MICWTSLGLALILGVTQDLCFFCFLLCLETKASWLVKQERITSAETSMTCKKHGKKGQGKAWHLPSHLQITNENPPFRHGQVTSTPLLAVTTLPWKVLATAPTMLTASTNSCILYFTTQGGPRGNFISIRRRSLHHKTLRVRIRILNVARSGGCWPGSTGIHWPTSVASTSDGSKTTPPTESEASERALGWQHFRIPLQGSP